MYVRFPNEHVSQSQKIYKVTKIIVAKQNIRVLYSTTDKNKFKQSYNTKILQEV